MNTFERWRERWNNLQYACSQKRFTARWKQGESQPPIYKIADPASLNEVSQVETELGMSIPSSLRTVMLKYTSSVRIEWQRRDEGSHDFTDIFAGECRWSLQELPTLYNDYTSWVTNVFHNVNRSYDRVWHNKFPVLSVADGSMIGIELGIPGAQPVVYLSHDDDREHGFWLGKDFQDYIERLSKIGCVGSECWQLSGFLPKQESYIQTDTPYARQWQNWLGLPAE